MVITTTTTLFKQKMDTINSNIEKIKQSLNKNTPPIFIELIGTPKSGKTTLLKSMKTAFEKGGIEIFTRRETAEYNPVDKDSKEYNLWKVLELFKNLSEDVSNKNGKIVVYDRGILDRIAWLECARKSGEIKEEDFAIIRRLYDLDMIKDYKPITYSFLTSPKLSIKRKGKTGKFVNVDSLTQYNTELMRGEAKVKSLSSDYSLIKTDEYEGRIEEFVVDTSLDIANKIERSLRERNVVQEQIRE